MKRLIVAALLLGGLAVTARAHFVFIIPADGKQSAQVVFSDSLRPDRAELLKKIAATTTFVVDAGGKPSPLQPKAGDGPLLLDVKSKGPVWVAGATQYGVVDKGKSPYLLNYYAKALVGTRPASWPSKDYLARRLGNPPLDIVLVEKGDKFWVAKVYFRGKPLKAAPVALYVPGTAEPVERKTDDQGAIKLLTPKEMGLYGVRVGHTEKAQGKHEGKEYKEVRYYATLVFLTPPAGSSSAPSARRITVAADKGAKAESRVVEDSQASKLLADARAARANWDGFPGFRADVAVNADGKVSRGKVEVGANGKVSLKLDGDQAEWTRRLLSSLVSHRLDDASVINTPCRFADDVTDHPLGRSIRVLNDEYHSSYRIRDRQVIEVNRRMGDARFTITVLENRQNAEKKYLPAHYVVNTWDVKGGALRQSVTHHNTWTRVGKFDLPRTVMVVTSVHGKQSAQTIELSGHRLNGK